MRKKRNNTTVAIIQVNAFTARAAYVKIFDTKFPCSSYVYAKKSNFTYNPDKNNNNYNNNNNCGITSKHANNSEESNYVIFDSSSKEISPLKRELFPQLEDSWDEL